LTNRFKIFFFGQNLTLERLIEGLFSPPSGIDDTKLVSFVMDG
jgi:hypothetical protein